jgi:transcription antitermination factor NusG
MSFSNGDRVKVKSGPFAGEPGTIRTCDERGTVGFGQWEKGPHVWVVLDNSNQLGKQPSWRAKANLTNI